MAKNADINKLKVKLRKELSEAGLNINEYRVKVAITGISKMIYEQMQEAYKREQEIFDFCANEVCGVGNKYPTDWAKQDAIKAKKINF